MPMPRPVPSAASLRQDALMYLSRRTNRSLAPPDWLSLNVTLRCNLRCRMCTTCYDVGDELSTREVMDVMDQAALLGVRVLNLLGGEPFVRADLEDLLEHASRKDLYTTVTTNGTLLTPDRAARVAVVPPERLHFVFSFDGLPPVHDAVRGPGAWDRAWAGYEALRRADAEAGHPRRKCLANVLLHARNLSSFLDLLDRLADGGLDGATVLTLFRPPADTADRAPDLRFATADLPAVERLVDVLLERRRAPPHPAFRLQNGEEDLRLIPAYHAGRLAPFQAPCWAGWKEMYVNADGGVIQCDGRLDFLAGRFGSVREHTLQELWASDALRDRRRVVKACRTPCAQTCYLRRSSDGAGTLVAAAGQLAAAALRARLPPLPVLGRRPRARVPAGLLTLELTDVCDCGWDGCTTPLERLQALLATAPAPLSACHADPALWRHWRDRHYVDFGRGFLGFEVIRAVLDDLRRKGPGFDTLAVRWRGEPLLHPEIQPVLRTILGATGPGQPFGRLRVETSALLLGDDLVEVVREAAGVPQEWWIDLDRQGAAADRARDHVARLVDARGSDTRLVLLRTVPADGLDDAVVDGDLARWRPLLPHLDPMVGTPLRDGDLYVLRRADPRTFLGDRAAHTALAGAATARGWPILAPDPRAPRHCPGPHRTPVVSWDGKVTLCRWDGALALKVGEVTTRPLSEIWRSEHLVAIREGTASQGVPPFPSCLDCHQPLSPNEEP